jgi:hypothetical protein
MASAVEQGDGAPCFGWSVAALHANWKSRIAAALGNAALCLCCLLLPVTFGRAQSLPPDATSIQTTIPAPGLLPPYEVNKVVRAAGFSPLAAPRREGAVYVLRAIDRHDVLTRIVVDARSGAIRAVNRLVSVKPIGVVEKMPASDSGVGADSAVSGSPSKDLVSNPPQHEAPSEQLRSGPQPNTPTHTVPPDISGSAVEPAEGDLGPSLSPMTPPGTHPASQGSKAALPRPRPSELKMEKVRAPPKARTVKPNAVPAAASVSSVAPRSAPTTERKPSQAASPH